MGSKTKDGYSLNLVLGPATRKRPKAGDLFCVEYEDCGFVFGRVIDPELPADMFLGKALLIYVYDGVYPANEMPPAEAMLATNLMFAPMIIDKSPWSYGGIRILANIPLEPDQVLATHCIVDRNRRNPMYFTIEGESLDEPVEPLIAGGTTNIRTLDLHISEALSLPPPS